MIYVETNELIGKPLDWAVAKAEGLIGGPYCYKVDRDQVHCEGVLPNGVLDAPESAFDICINKLRYSSNWSLAGPIIEREGIDPDPMLDDENKPIHWACFLSKNGKLIDGNGPTLLIAAMRCFVASMLGDRVDIPEELL